MRIRIALALASLFLAPSAALAADYYLDPNGGSATASGAADDPWGSLEEVVGSGVFESTVEAGDRLLLLSGYHGDPDFAGGDFEPEVLIEAAEGELPLLRHLRVGAVSGLRLSGLSISPAHDPDGAESSTLVEVLDAASRITVENCSIFSADDASEWSADDWVSGASSGMSAGGAEVTLRNNVIRNVRFGISVDGENAHVVGNTIDGFSADGLRGLGDFGVFEYNVVKNAMVDGDLDENHDDGFQSWSVGPDGVGTGEVVGVELRGNVIVNYEDESHPFRATLQGIGCFDGTFTDWVIENNVVITDHWHGITLLGARNSRIVNNTVIDNNDETPGPPWISIDAHKDGTAPEGCLVRNNLATDYANADTGVDEDHNFTITDPFALFVDPAAFDLRLLPDAEVLDQGTAELAPSIDADGIARPQGDGVDLGAYEWHDADVAPDGGAGVGGGRTVLEPGGGGMAPAGDGGTTDAPAGGGEAGGAGTTEPVGGFGGDQGGSDADEPSGSSRTGSDAGPSVDDDAAGGSSGGCECRVHRAAGGGRVSPWFLTLLLLVLRIRPRGRCAN